MKRYRIFIVGLLQVLLAFSGKAQPGNPLSGIKDVASLAFDTASFSKDDTSHIIIADIYITGNKKTKPYIVEREIPFKIGNHMRRGELPDKLELAREQLMNTTLFVDVDVKVDHQVDDLIFITVIVKERWYFFPLPYFKIVDRNFNEWWVVHKRSLKRVNYGLKLIHTNFSGRNDELNLALINGYSQQASFSYTQPAADKSLKYGFSVALDYSRNKEVAYNIDSNKLVFIKDDDFLAESFRGEIGISYRPKIKTRHFLKFAYTRASVKDLVLAQNPEYFPGGKNVVHFPDITYSITHNNVDYIPYPTKGVTFSASLQKRGFTKDINMWQLSSSATYTIPIAKKTQVYLQATGAIKLPFDQPYYNKRLFGFGDLYMRGLEYYVADGVAGFVSRATIRKEVLNFKIKSLINIQGHERIPFRIFLKAFGDLGYAYDKTPTNYSMLSNKWLHSWGVGVDVLSFYDFVIRFEFSFNQLSEHDLFIHSRGDF